jgi:hypothetical protein
VIARLLVPLETAETELGLPTSSNSLSMGLPVSQGHGTIFLEM